MVTDDRYSQNDRGTLTGCAATSTRPDVATLEEHEAGDRA
jgi:hypothetical protein